MFREHNPSVKNIKLESVKSALKRGVKVEKYKLNSRRKVNKRVINLDDLLTKAATKLERDLINSIKTYHE